MADIALRDALTALKTKIQAVSVADGTTAEDLAMLGTALERIAGRVSAVELEMIGDELRTALQTLADTKTAEYQSLIDSTSDAFTALADDRTAQFTALSNQKELDYNNLSATKEADLSALAALETENAIDKVEAAYFVSMASSGFSAGSATVNPDGFYTSYDTGTGKVYSDITYDELNRVESWTETLTDPQGNTMAFNYAVAYAPDGLVASVTRTIATGGL